MWGYRQPAKVTGPVIRFMSETVGVELPKD
jgi:hypothetical protein